jgi:magnesium chelatase family protein
LLLLYPLKLEKVFLFQNTMLVKTFGCAVHGILATKITIEVDMVAGVNFYLVGLPDSAVKESHQRIDAALKNTGM